MGLIFKFHTMQQLANHFSDLFSNQKSIASHRSIGIEFVQFLIIASSIVSIIIAIYCEVAFKLDH